MSLISFLLVIIILTELNSWQLEKIKLSECMTNKLEHLLLSLKEEVQENLDILTVFSAQSSAKMIQI